MSHTPDIARMKRELAELIAIRTENPPGREADAAVYVRDMLLSAGFAVDITEYKPGRFNVEARLDNGPGPVFAFNTHMDTVPAGDGWSSDPFTLREADGKLYGRGACDCKGPLIAMVEAMRMLAWVVHEGRLTITAEQRRNIVRFVGSLLDDADLPPGFAAVGSSEES